MPSHLYKLPYHIKINRTDLPQKEIEFVEEIERELAALGCHFLKLKKHWANFDGSESHDSRQNYAKLWTDELFDFGQTLQKYLTEYLKETPTLSGRIDLKSLHSARSLFTKKFPDYFSVRTAADHIADFRNEKLKDKSAPKDDSPKEKRHPCKEPFHKFGVRSTGQGSVMLQKVLYNDEDFVFTKLGKIVSIKINLESMNVLQEILDLIVLAFEK